METHWRFNGSSGKGRDELRTGEDVYGKSSLSPLTLFQSPFSPIGKSQRTALYKALISYLPPRPQFDTMIEFYYQELDVMDHCFHRGRLLSSLNSFWTTDPSNKGTDTKELSFLALLFALLLGSASILTKDRWHMIGVRNESLEDFNEILEKWNLAYLTLLAASDWVQTPDINALQSVIVVRREFEEERRIRPLFLRFLTFIFFIFSILPLWRVLLEE